MILRKLSSIIFSGEGSRVGIQLLITGHIPGTFFIRFGGGFIIDVIPI